MTNKMKFEVELHEDGPFKATCRRVEERLLITKGVKKVTLLTAVGDLIPNKSKSEPLKDKCPYCKLPMRWEQFKEIWICREHGKFDEGV